MKIRLLTHDIELGCDWLSQWSDIHESPYWSVEENALELSPLEASRIATRITQKYRFYACEVRDKAPQRSDDPKNAIIDAMKAGTISKEDGVKALRKLAHTPEKPRSEAPTRKEGHPRNYPSGIREEKPEDDCEYDD